MKKFLKVTAVIIAVIVLCIAGLLTYVKTALPKVSDAPDMKVEMTPERIERGKYLANHVSACMDCHSKRDWTKFAGPPVPGTEGMGGEAFTEEMGFPGNFYAPNITPARLKDWTDGDIFRAITTGVSKDGRALFPIMPYPYYSKMDEEDIKSIIAYIRTLSPKENNVPPSETKFPMSFIINTIPEDPQFTKIPDKSNKLEYGKYMTNASGCIECHSQVDKGEKLPGMEFAGGRDLSGIQSANITPDMETGIGGWNEEIFISKFKSRSDTQNSSHFSETMNTPMPWTMYGGMTDDDLKAIYAYIKTVKPVKNKVERKF